MKIDGLNPGLEGQLGAGRINAYFAVNPGAIGVPLTQTEKISVHPNPANDKLVLNVSTENYDNHISIFNALGERQELITTNREFKKVELDISHLSPGIYFLKSNSNNQTVTTRFLKL